MQGSPFSSADHVQGPPGVGHVADAIQPEGCCQVRHTRPSGGWRVVVVLVVVVNVVVAVTLVSVAVAVATAVAVAVAVAVASVRRSVVVSTASPFRQSQQECK